MSQQLYVRKKVNILMRSFYWSSFQMLELENRGITITSHIPYLFHSIVPVYYCLASIIFLEIMKRYQTGDSCNISLSLIQATLTLVIGTSP